MLSVSGSEPSSAIRTARLRPSSARLCASMPTNFGCQASPSVIRASRRCSEVVDGGLVVAVGVGGVPPGVRRRRGRPQLLADRLLRLPVEVAGDVLAVVPVEGQLILRGLEELVDRPAVVAPAPCAAERDRLDVVALKPLGLPAVPVFDHLDDLSEVRALGRGGVRDAPVVRARLRRQPDLAVHVRDLVLDHVPSSPTTRLAGTASTFGQDWNFTVTA